MPLRDYQVQCVDKARDILFKQGRRSVVLQLPTGSGKTAIVSEITSLIYKNKKRAWFIVPRKELVKQSSESFVKWHIPHGKIDASSKESRAYKVHIISLQTLMRRLEKIKEFPHIAFFDECHLNYDAQQKIMRYFECAECEGVFFADGARRCGDSARFGEPCRKVEECERWSV